jgi:TM2 domain-containing membrane protein YozV
MHKNIKAALLSAFILPGMGQLYKGEKIKGGIFLLLVNIFLLTALFIVMKGMGSFLLTAKLSGSAEALKVLETIQQQSPLINWLLTAFMALWIAAIIDAALAKPPVDHDHSR